LELWSIFLKVSLLQGKIDSKRGPGRRRISWLDNLRIWFDKSSAELFRIATNKITAGLYLRTAGLYLRTAGLYLRSTGLYLRTAGLYSRTTGLYLRGQGAGLFLFLNVVHNILKILYYSGKIENAFGIYY
jgi:hypothetical protein